MESILLEIFKSENIYRLGLMIPGLTLIFERNALTRKTIAHYCMCMALYSYIKKIKNKNLPYYHCLIGSLVDKLKIRTLINML